MSLPFTVEQFFGVFAAYNRGVWPAQRVLVALGVLAVLLAVRPTAGASRAASGILAALWAWMAVAYHVLFFAPINPVARVFAALFLVQAALFAYYGPVAGRLRFGGASRARTVAGWALVVYGLAVYPVVGWLAGHRYPAMPTFGVPCPTTVVTLGLLLFVRPPFPWPVAVVPLLWSAVGSRAAFALGVPQDLGLLAAGVVVLAAVLFPQRPAGSEA